MALTTSLLKIILKKDLEGHKWLFWKNGSQELNQTFFSICSDNAILVEWWIFADLDAGCMKIHVYVY